MGFKIERNLLFLAFVGKDGTDEENETIRWHPAVQL